LHGSHISGHLAAVADPRVADFAAVFDHDGQLIRALNHKIDAGAALDDVPGRARELQHINMGAEAFQLAEELGALAERIESSRRCGGFRSACWKCGEEGENESD